MKIEILDTGNIALWDTYVRSHAQATLYHLAGWKHIIQKTYDHKAYYLIAYDNNDHNTASTQNWQDNKRQNDQTITGILPLVHLKHFLFGNSLISVPFFDLGGILADNEQTERALLCHAVRLGEKLKTDHIELRHIEPLASLKSDILSPSGKNWPVRTRSHKVRMLLSLPESGDALMKSFKSKLRSQIRRPLKDGLYSKIGGFELLDDFYQVFAVNMRDLGSPVHSRKLMHNILETFPKQAKIVIVYKDKQPLACSFIIGFKDTLENPWASALRKYSRMSPNMLLYWSMLEYACDNGYAYFDFGRSSPDEGTYKFKAQWGAKPAPLHWQYFLRKNDGDTCQAENPEKEKFNKVIQYWKKLPVSVTKIIGPLIRKHIGL